MTKEQTKTPRKRLVVELAPKVDEQLKELVKIEEANKTLIVNKAIQLLRLIRSWEENGDFIQIVSPDGEITKLTILKN